MFLLDRPIHYPYRIIVSKQLHGKHFNNYVYSSIIPDGKMVKHIWLNRIWRNPAYKLVLYGTLSL